ncbi:hypothetical protein QNH48_29205 [Neobacillus sp. YX16]|uniref:hypothetical protein n=1 Tax=Neobacillus sp. YX16 TaxID=3047874 RepID=UPI0024C22383|nr:hypothetical protein [Neobacillus sp. YX16]WHZ02946.1 hypothetical protein QNH48_29205 [Neobacillus sp. YX16]
MFVIATFENSIYIELAITALEQQGISKELILAAPLDKRKELRGLFDTIHKSDGFSLFDGPSILGTCLMLLGAIYGYVLEWGPILWGIIGAVSGLLLGFLLKMLILRKNKRGSSKITSEIVLMVRCEDHKWEQVEKLLWDHFALGLTKI